MSANGQAEVVVVVASRLMLEGLKEWRGPLWVKAEEDDAGWQLIFREGGPEDDDE